MDIARLSDRWDSGAEPMKQVESRLIGADGGSGKSYQPGTVTMPAESIEPTESRKLRGSKKVSAGFCQVR